MDFSDSSQRSGIIGAIVGFALSFISAPILRYLIPVIVVVIIALLFGRMDSHLKSHFGVIGSASAAVIAYLLEPLTHATQGLLRGIFSLFSCFLMTVFGYFASETMFGYSFGDEDEDEVL